MSAIKSRPAVTEAPLLTRGDDFNALAAAELRTDLGLGHVYRIAPEPDEPDLLPPAIPADIQRCCSSSAPMANARGDR